MKRCTSQVDTAIASQNRLLRLYAWARANPQLFEQVTVLAK